MNTAKKIRVRKAAQAAAGFKSSAPRCDTCKHFEPAVRGDGDVPHKPPICALLDFRTRAYAVCNYWAARALAKPEGDR